MMCCGRPGQYLRYYSTQLIVLIAPIIYLPLPIFIAGQEAQAAYVLLIMGTYWCTEAVPLAITALVPIFLFPMLEVLTTKEVCDQFMQSQTMMIVGAMILALAVEKCNLHRRIALKTLLIIGHSPRWLMFGAILPSWFLSMWISNTATAAMMMPIIQEVIDKLKATSRLQQLQTNGNAVALDHDKQGNLNEGFEGDVSYLNGDIKPDITIINVDSPDVIIMPTEASTNSYSLPTLWEQTEPEPEKQETSLDRYYDRLNKALIISVAYASNVGGGATLIGTGSNLVFKGQADIVWQKNGLEESPINFTSYMAIGIPIVTINMILVWVWLEFFYIGVRDFCGCTKTDGGRQGAIIKRVISLEYHRLGSITYAEVMVTFLFTLMVLLWFFRSPGFMHGWGVFFTNGYVADSATAMCISFLLFVIPARYKSDLSKGKAETLMDWKTMKSFHWDLVLLFGGGFALAEGIVKSGLSDWVGARLAGLDSLPTVVLIYVFSFIITMVTQVTSNQACASIMLPIAAGMAEKMGKNPLYLMIPVALAVQMAFMLPVSHPPNAIAYGTGKLKVMDMVKAGFVCNLLCVLTLTAGHLTYISAFFDLDQIPWEAKTAGDIHTNITTMATTIVS